eukprot:SAG31_NODE_17017_length_686_cov_1.318569_1_plen_152_part_01
MVLHSSCSLLVLLTPPFTGATVGQPRRSLTKLDTTEPVWRFFADFHIDESAAVSHLLLDVYDYDAGDAKSLNPASDWFVYFFMFIVSCSFFHVHFFMFTFSLFLFFHVHFFFVFIFFVFFSVVQRWTTEKINIAKSLNPTSDWFALARTGYH